jgi:hypothetical protein
VGTFIEYIYLQPTVDISTPIGLVHLQICDRGVHSLNLVDAVECQRINYDDVKCDVVVSTCDNGACVCVCVLFVVIIFIRIM